MIYVYDLGRQPGRLCVCSLQKINFLTMNPLQYKFDFWMFIRGISHGFNGTHDKLEFDGSEFKGYFVIFYIFCFQEQRGGDCS